MIAPDDDARSPEGRELAHDLKNWLTPVQTCLQLWTRGELRQAQELRPAATANLAAALACLEEQLRRGPAAPLTLRETNVAGLLRRAADMAAPQARAQNISLRVVTEATLTMLADEVLLLRLLSNLLANGLRAAPPGAIVRLAAGASAARPGWLWLEVANPCGATDGAAGTRLGLRICREIAALHGGQLDIITDAAAATVTVRAELPAAAGQPVPH